MNDQLAVFFKPVTKLFSKHHSFIFVIFSVLILAAAIYSLYDVLSLSNPTSSDVQSSISGFDQKTIDQIKQLRDSSDTPENVVFPSPRVNPFVEK